MQKAGRLSKHKISFETVILIYSIVLIATLCLFGSGNNAIAIVALVGFAPLILRPEFLIGPILFSNIFSGYVLVGEGQSLARYLVLFFVIGVTARILYENKKIKFDFWLKSLIVIVVSSSLLSMWGLFGHTGLPTVYIYNLFFFFCVMNCTVTSKDLLMKEIWIFTLISAVYSGWYLLQNGLSAFDEGRVGAFEGGVNPNNIAQGITYIGIITLAHFLIHNLKGKLIHIPIIVFMVFLIFLTGSRSALIAFVVASVFTILYWLKGSNKVVSASFVIIAFLIACYFLYNYLLDAFPELMSRFTLEDVMDNGGTGRVDVWTAFMQHYFLDYWMFGIGFNASNIYDAVKVVNGVGHGAHNLIIDILASSGIFGLVVYGMIYVRTYKEMFREVKHDKSMLMFLALYTAIIATGVGENVFRGRMIWFVNGLILLLISVNKREREQNQSLQTLLEYKNGEVK